jgi:hypothetical protein
MLAVLEPLAVVLLTAALLTACGLEIWKRRCSTIRGA